MKGIGEATVPSHMKNCSSWHEVSETQLGDPAMAAAISAFVQPMRLIPCRTWMSRACLSSLLPSAALLERQVLQGHGEG